MQRYRRAGLVGSGTYADVFRALDTTTGRYVAIKCLRQSFRSGFEAHNVLEVVALKAIGPHTNVVRLLEVLYDRSTGRLALVFELMESTLQPTALPRESVPSMLRQLLLAVEHIHRKGYFHRDIKPENILVNVTGNILKLADLGTARKTNSTTEASPYVCTRWYRAPECLLTHGLYSSPMDMWSVGCVFFEMLARYPLFKGSSEIDQVQRIRAVLGSPPPKLKKRMRPEMAHQYCVVCGDEDEDEMAWTGGQAPARLGVAESKIELRLPPDVLSDPLAVDLLRRLLRYDPKKRLTAAMALTHPYVAFAALPLRSTAEKKLSLLLPSPLTTTTTHSHVSRRGRGSRQTAQSRGRSRHRVHRHAVAQPRRLSKRQQAPRRALTR